MKFEKYLIKFEFLRAFATQACLPQWPGCQIFGSTSYLRYHIHFSIGVSSLGHPKIMGTDFFLWIFVLSSPLRGLFLVH